ncbi:hypothetical protein PISMIDRAFT_672168 [Pisolithus microcarpus 441]|uniref:Uncharacterized protein n=1 Tax=Pisolithus microcarpus 441 TaxID=765257 RepID=A0A0C9YWP3_9AGAM|nr:hypothetical protein PISMIDRAFT_672168 [Pisolithus microcarpus 441]
MSLASQPSTETPAVVVKKSNYKSSPTASLKVLPVVSLADVGTGGFGDRKFERAEDIRFTRTETLTPSAQLKGQAAEQDKG